MDCLNVRDFKVASNYWNSLKLYTGLLALSPDLGSFPIAFNAGDASEAVLLWTDLPSNPLLVVVLFRF